ncbi:MAG: hypothetical protein ACWA6X_01630, partial [Bauldia sp.]
VLPVEVTDPPFDPATQVRTGPVLTIEATRVTRVWTVRDKTAEELAAALEAARDFGIAPMDKEGRFERAFALLFLDELNHHAAKLQQVLTAAAQTTSLADFKTRMSNITPIPQRTAEQLRDAIRAKIGT